MIVFLSIILLIIILVEGFILIFSYNILKKIDQQTEEPLIENLSNLNIYSSVLNSNNYIIIKGIIFNDNFKIDVNLLIDSGANRSLLKKEILEKVSKIKSSTEMYYGSGDSNIVNIYEANLQLNNKNYLIEFAELSDTMKQFDHLFVGILGTDFLTTTRSYIDYKNNILICQDF